MSRAASPWRGLSSRLTRCHRRAEEQLPDPTGVGVTGVPAASASASLPWEGRKNHSSAPLFPGWGSSLPSRSPSGSLKLLAGVWASGPCGPGSFTTAFLLAHRKLGPGQASPGEDGGPVSTSAPRGQGWSLVTEQLPSTRQKPRGTSPLDPWPCTHREGLDTPSPTCLSAADSDTLSSGAPRAPPLATRAAERFSPVT